MMRLESPWLKADAARERELFRYFDPPELAAKARLKASQHNLSVENDDPLAASAPSSPETTLTALAQLCALRLNASRAMVSLISKETQYFIAEATKTLDLVDNQLCDEEGDTLWAGCGSVEKSGRLCERTIELPPSSAAPYPCFTVTDLTQDEQFNKLPFVTGPPNFRFYAGTPITTKDGINIGSLFILDDKVRPRLLPAQEKFLGTIAATIMGHLEVNREAEERRKVLRMAKGLNAFVEGKSSFHTSNLTDEETPITPSNDVHYDTESIHENIESAHKATFSRAANLLSDSLNLRRHGGVCFLDTITGLRSTTVRRTEKSGRELDREGDAKESPRGNGREQEGNSPTLDRHQEDTKLAEVISSSCSRQVPGSTEEGSTPQAFKPPDERLVQSLLKQYPRGKVWLFDGVDGMTSEEDDPPPLSAANSEEQRPGRSSRQQVQKDTLRSCFPNVFELIFVPLWDAGSSRWFSGCFCWRASVNRKFSIEAELQFVTAFGNSIMAEISRLASIYESRQKGDFIGSISHELRSPLHGILGSAEFLSETHFDNFQGSLLDTISSCGRTLLDTIEHILDFSKINSFERNWRNAKKPKGRKWSNNDEATRRAVAKEAPPMMSIFAVVDVAAIIEEVVEGNYAGQMYRDSDRGTAMNYQSQLRGAAETMKTKDVEVVLDMEQGDYCFATQPGALRRVIMNVFGNSLKYTSTGNILVKIRLEDPETSSEAQDKSKVLDITITDTGRGISSGYLRTSLYTPFSQEDTLANGTGLGLSIVRSIVAMLEGTIHIKSQVGQGTEVQVRVPLSREAGGDTPVSTPTSVASQPQEDTISVLQKDYPSKSVSIYSDGMSDVNIGQDIETIRMVAYYVKQWFNLAIESYSDQKRTDVIIVTEADLPALLKRLRPGPAVVVLCTKTHRLQVAQSLYQGAIEFMSTPFGPHKLAKAIRLSLERSDDIAAGVTPQPSLAIHSPRSSESESVLPEYEPISLETDDEATPIKIQTNGVVAASQSSNARMALGTPSSDASNGSREDFPFPAQGTDHSRTESPRSVLEGMRRQESSRPNLSSRMTEPVLRPRHAYTSALTGQGQLATTDARDKVDGASTTPSAVELGPSSTDSQGKSEPIPNVDGIDEQRPPRILLVDDNKINLRLLETFMRKRKYQLVDSAEDGSLAVEAAKKHPQGYDVIFMDLSMPVMNGFEATRAIRELEQTRDPTTYAQNPKPAMIVALTGLASGRDHGEAFACGVDLYMTKPVSFKEVGRLLDNWEAHRGTEASKTSNGG